MEATNLEEKKDGGSWKQTICPNTLQPYYYHTVTKKTTWEMPEELKGNLAFGEIETQQKLNEVEQEFENKKEEIINDTNVNNNSSNITTTDNITSNYEQQLLQQQIQQQIAQQPLSSIHNDKINKVDARSIWRMAIDPTSGKKYYYSTITGQSQWEEPPELSSNNFEIPSTGDYAIHTAITGRRHRRSMKEMQCAWDRGERAGLWECPDCSKILTEGSKKTHPDSCNARKARNVQMLPGAPPEILSGAHWKSVRDEKTGNTYYYHQITKQSSWHKPAEMTNYEQYQQNQSMIQNSMNPNNVLSHWNEVTDPSGQTYYFNSFSGVTSINKPYELSEEATLNNNNQILMNEQTNDITKENLTVTIPQENDNKQVGEWIEAYDGNTKKKYYYNSVTKESNWEKPATITKNTEDIHKDNIVNENESLSINPHTINGKIGSELSINDKTGHDVKRKSEFEDNETEINNKKFKVDTEEYKDETTLLKNKSTVDLNFRKEVKQFYDKNDSKVEKLSQSKEEEEKVGDVNLNKAMKTNGNQEEVDIVEKEKEDKVP